MSFLFTNFEIHFILKNKIIQDSFNMNQISSISIDKLCLELINVINL